MLFAHRPDIRKVRQSICVLHEPQSGQIRHMHATLVLEGGRDQSKSEAEQAARAALERRGKPHAHLAVLHVENFAPAQFRRYRVDVATKRLVEVSP